MLRDSKSKYSRKVLSFVLGSISIIFLIFTIISAVVFTFLYTSYKNSIIESTNSKLEMLSISTKATFEEVKSVSKNLSMKNLLKTIVLKMTLFRLIMFMVHIC